MTRKAQRQSSLLTARFRAGRHQFGWIIGAWACIAGTKSARRQDDRPARDTGNKAYRHRVLRAERDRRSTIKCEAVFPSALQSRIADPIGFALNLTPQAARRRLLVEHRVNSRFDIDARHRE